VNLPLVELDEAGVHFETGVPVTFNFVRNTVSSEVYGTEFQQHIEPAGRFMLLRGPWASPEPPPEWEYGRVRFEKPLVLMFNETGEHAYDENSWKALLSAAYGGKTGRALTKALLKDGYDGIVTVGEFRGELETKEIVDLTVFKDRKLKAKLLR
jgi:hypothetical protein